MVLEMVLESLFAVIDVFWVGRLGANAVATVGITESMLALVFAIGLGVSMSTTAMVARRIGEKDPEDAAIAGVQAVVVGAGDLAGARDSGGDLRAGVAAAMGASPEIVASGSGYARIALGGCGAIIMLFLNNAIFRGAGDAAIAMRLLWVSNIINLVLDPCLIFGLGPFPRMGVTGAALATFTGRSIGVLYQFYRLMKGTERIHILARHLRLNVRVMVRLLRVSLTGILQFAIANASWIVLVRIISLFGAAAVAGYTIAIRIVVFFILPSWGLSNAAATLVGQNLGAKRPDRAAQSVWRTGFYNMMFLGAIGVFFIVFATPVVRLFVNDPAVVPIAASGTADVQLRQHRVCLRHGDAAGVQWRGRHADADDCEFLRLLGAGAAAGVVAGGVAALASEGAFLAIVIAECSIAVAGMVLFRRGRWARQQI